MDLSDVFIVLVVSHLAGDFLLQTEFQAMRKPGGLCRGDAVARRALVMHVVTYASALAPALVWIALEVDVLRALAAGGLVLGTHLVQDDGRLLHLWSRRVKHTELQPGSTLAIAVDQSAHALAILGAALVAAA